jgi:hypothetical protein
VSFDLKDYAEIDHGYAATVHKSQGVTVDRAHVLATRGMDRHAAYVGLSRHRDGVTLHWSRDEIGSRDGLDVRLGRERLKDTSLDYMAVPLEAVAQPKAGQGASRKQNAAAYHTSAYAERRGLVPESEIIFRERQMEMQPPPSWIAADHAREAERARDIAAGRAGFRERYEARRREQAAEQTARELAEREEQARGLVRAWDGLIKAYGDALPQIEKDSTLGGTRDRLLWFGASLEAGPKVVTLLRERGREFGLEDRPNLARVLSAAQPEQVITGIMEKSETDMRAQVKIEAEAERVRQREERRLERGRDHGMSMER